MISKKIPSNYLFNPEDLFNIILDVKPNVKIKLQGHILKIYADLTQEELQTIKTEFLKKVEIIEEL